MMSAYVQAYTLSSVFLTEADSGMHDGPKVSLNTPPPRESTPPRVYPRQVAAPESLGAIRFPVSFTRIARKETLRYLTAGKTSALDRGALRTCRTHSDMISV